MKLNLIVGINIILTMSDLSRLIEINKNIEKQNDEIIRLLKKIAGEEDSADKSGEISTKELVLEKPLGVGEVYFIYAENIFKLSIQNNESVINNLTGNVETPDFNLAEIIANESITKNQSLADSTVILDESVKGNLPETLRLSIENGAKYAHIPWSAMSELIRAPQQLQTLLKLNFYKSTEDLINKLFESD